MAASELGAKYQRLIQMLWDSEPRNDEPDHPPIFFLGKEYESTETQDYLGHYAETRVFSSLPKVLDDEQRLPPTATDRANGRQWPAAFLSDFESRLWFTYRNGFPAITRSDNPDAAASLTLAVRLRNIGEPNVFTSDTGWGCMIRSGQCLLANALVILSLDRDWRRGTRQNEEKSLIALFADDIRAPFSLHKFVQHGADACGKYPGEWFGPSATAQCIQALANASSPRRLRVHIADDGARVHCADIKALAYDDSDAFQPVLVLAGVRLGIDRVTPIYRASLKALFKLKQFVGIAGGRPSASYYFIASQGDHFFYLDPHQTKPALPYRENSSTYDESEVNSLHTSRLRRLHIDKMDPSMLLAFLLCNANDLTEWKSAMQEVESGCIISVLEDVVNNGNQQPERESAIDEVEAFDETEDESEATVLAQGSVKSNGTDNDHQGRDNT